MPKAKPKSPFTARCRIVSMSAWDAEFIDEEEEGFFEFNDRGWVEFHFGCVQGHTDYRLTTRDGEPAVEWTWDGNDEMDAAQRRVWAVVKGDKLHGMIFFHAGDDSEFVAKKAKGPERKKRIRGRCVEEVGWEARMKANQPDQQTPTSDRIRAAVEKNPRKMTLQLARDLGVPEVEVIRAFPTDRVVELGIARWEELFRNLELFGAVRVLVSNGAVTIEVDGRFGGFSTTGEFFNVQTDSLDMHIRWRELAAVFAVEKPGHMDGMATRSVQFFDHSGAAAVKVFLNFGESISPEREKRFIELRAKFKR
jgi:putative hemin transport protein